MDTQTLLRGAFTLSPDWPVILMLTAITHTHLGIWSSHAKSFLYPHASGMVISTLAWSWLANLSSQCLHMCGRSRPPPRLTVYSNSLQVMPVVIKVKHPARSSETNLSSWSYYGQIKLSCPGQRGRKVYNLNKNTLVLASASAVIVHRCLYLINSMPRHWWEYSVISSNSADAYKHTFTS